MKILGARAAGVCLSLSLVLGCGGGNGATSSTTGAGGSGSTSTTGAGGSGSTSTTGAGGATGAGGSGGSTTSAGTGGQGGQGSSGEGGAGGGPMTNLQSLLVGEWEPVSFQDSGNPPEPAPPGSPFNVFKEGGNFVMGCGTPPIGTWTFHLDAPPPAIARVDVSFGGNAPIAWYILELDTQTFVFAEGGDIFSYKRSSCP